MGKKRYVRSVKRGRVEKEAKKPPRKKKTSDYLALAAIALVIFILIRYVSMPLAASSEARKNCPYEIRGSDEPLLTIQYVDSISCMWCWIQKPILHRLVEEHNDSVRLESYDINNCHEIRRRHEFYGTPSFVFKIRGDERELPVSGFIEEERLHAIVCESTGEC